MAMPQVKVQVVSVPEIQERESRSGNKYCQLDLQTIIDGMVGVTTLMADKKEELEGYQAGDYMGDFIHGRNDFFNHEFTVGNLQPVKAQRAA